MTFCCPTARRLFVAGVALLAAAGAGVAYTTLAADAKDAPKKEAPKADPSKPVIPHAQKAPPGPALSPAEAMAKMELPDGFKVECVASEPLIVNPTSFTWDDRGRIWVTESVEYPRASAGVGQDRVKILEDTDGDGVYDKATIFKDGLNIPCGVAHGNGGVYVTNSPDILFLKDTDGDGKADTQEVILTGFGRADRHELPNSLTWGPDGWLYGMNGVFNPSVVKDPASDKVYKFSCAIWRYHPPTKRFEVFSEGTSNPWGLDYNRAGEWFVSCCVIDHLFHMTQSAYYHRQGGAYPPNVQQAKLPSITTEKHQQAAYAGLCIYDADAYPEEFRGRFIMGNLHGSALNQDVVVRNGSTYRQSNVKAKGKDDPHPLNDGMGSLDFLQANDAWFMPVAQKIGPDGCIYVMDWYDRYHCYQDANRDPAGLDRLKGRIYRISYKDTPKAKAFDVQTMSGFDLVALLSHQNVWWRRTAQRVLSERVGQLNAGAADPLFRSTWPQIYKQLYRMTTDTVPGNGNMHALWLLVSQNMVSDDLLKDLLSHPEEDTRAWGCRAIGNAGKASPAALAKLTEMVSSDPSMLVRAQAIIAAGRLSDADPLPILAAAMKDPANAKDPTLPHLIFMNLRPLVEKRGKDILTALEATPTAQQAFGDTTVKWVKQAIATSGRGAEDIVAEVLGNIKKTPEPKKAGQALDTLIDGLAHLPIVERANAVKGELRDRVTKYVESDDPSAQVPAVTIALWWRDAKAVEAARKIVADPKANIEPRIALAKTLAESRVIGNDAAFAALAADANVPIRLRQVALDALGGIGRSESAAEIVKLYASLPHELKPGSVNALARTPAGATALLDAIEKKAIPATDVSSTQARSVVALNDKAITARLAKVWGNVSTDRDPERVKVVEKYRGVVKAGTGNAAAGWKVFETTCAQCHTIYGKGGNVGPDLTGVGRDDLDAVLTSVLDPNLVIGAPYLVRTAKTKDGEVVSGLLVEESDSQVVLKDQTKQTAIPRANLDKLVVQNVSMMPEGLEKQLTDQQFRDLVAFLLTREPPK
ncbi:MAG TPA: PVC-type heme-binding CxxCH protein [Humisphaera sp.]